MTSDLCEGGTSIAVSVVVGEWGEVRVEGLGVEMTSDLWEGGTAIAVPFVQGGGERCG